MVRKRMLIRILLGAVLLGTAPLLSLAAPSLSRPAQEGQNLLRNPGF